MTEPTRASDWSPEVASRHWDILSERIESLVEAWERGTDPPEIRPLLPDEPPMLRRLVLVELIKVDLEYRWQHRHLPKKIEEYLDEFPELREGGVPADLIYEEYHVRYQANETISVHDYYERFPQQADELGRLLGIETSPRSTVLASREELQRVQVGTTIDDFDLLTRLGEGAFATVYLARQRSMQRLVALKVSSDRGNEPQTMAQLDHPHIVRIYDQRLLPEQRLRLLYMQYVAGGTLQAVIEHARKTPPSERTGRMLLEVIDGCLEQRGESPPLDSPTRHRLAEARWPTVVCWIGARIASALQYAHERGVLHRDIKPANVLLSADGNPKIVDFNVSFSSKLEGATPAAYFGGSLAYMSPEQIEACNPSHERQADELDGRSDVYSLGVMLWELLLGRRPFDDDAPSANWSATLAELTARRYAGVDPAVVAQIPSDAPPGLDEILLRCVAPRAEDRFATPGELARQLELCLQPQVQRLLRPPKGNWRHKVRRYPLSSLTVCAVVANLVVSLPNIYYNLNAIIHAIGEAALEVFRHQLMAVNPIAYGSGILICGGLALKATQAVAALQRGETLDGATVIAARRRCLHLGDIIAVGVFALWLIAGFVFPFWLAVAGVEVGWDHYTHFMVSQLLCGLLAATLSFFVVTFVSMRAMYPVLVRPDATDPDDINQLAALGRHVVYAFGLVVATPFIGVMALVLFGSELRQAFGVLSVFGLVASVLSFWLMREIFTDLSTLSAAVDPGGEGLAGSGSETIGSFWGQTRH